MQEEPNPSASARPQRQVERPNAVATTANDRPAKWHDRIRALDASIPAVDSKIAAILVLALGLRLWQLTDNSVWFDEAHSLSLASQPMVALLLEGVVHDLQSPLYFLLLKTWLLWFQSEFGVRLLSVLL